MIAKIDLDTYPPMRERELDIALAMAVRASSAIREWVAQAAGVPPGVSSKLMSVRVSASVADGREADVEVRFGDDQEPFVVEIENKINAPFGAGQAEAYAARACRVRESHGRGACLLFSPNRHSAAITRDDDTFRSHLAYEEFAVLLQNEGPWGHELAVLVEHAIRNHQRGGADTDEQLTKALVDVAAAAWSVELRPPTVNARVTGTWLVLEKTGFTQVGVDSYISIDPKHGIVDIEIYGGRAKFDEGRLAEALRDEPCEIRVGKASAKNLRITRRDAVPPKIELGQPIEDQRALVIELWKHVARLRNWWQERGAEIVRSCSRA
jgi:hypothetical protein